MSESLSQSFSDMRVAHPPLAQIPLPPQGNLNGRLQFYGYDITMDWLANYGQTHWKDHAGADRRSLISAAIHLLERHTGIRTLDYESALVDDAGPADRAIDGERDGEPMIPILSVCSSRRSSLKKRPTQDQLDALTSIIGRQPRWWIDYDLPEYY